MGMLTWQFEHFKTFTPYETMQQAASALDLFEGENTDGVNPRMGSLIQQLGKKTGHPAWMPEMDNDNFTFNDEGSVFRNKARLLSSFFICYPPTMLETKAVKLTSFGKALSRGAVNEEEYYRFIISRFKYPHPSFSDYEQWKKTGEITHPFLLILKVLVELFERYGLAEAYLEPQEIFHKIQPLSDDDSVSDVVNEIYNNRINGFEYQREQYRKVAEIMAFLAISGYVCYCGKDSIALNLIRRHKQGKVFYYLERSSQGIGTGKTRFKENVIDEIKSLWEESK